MVPQPAVHNGRRRHPALRRCLHRAVFHHVFHLAAALLLRLRLPRPCDHHTDGDVCRDLYRSLLLPAVQRGPPVVVALFLQCGGSGVLLAGLLVHLLLHAAGDGGLCAGVALLWVHDARLAAVRADDGHRRLLLFVVVRLEDLLRCQGGLSSTRSALRGAAGSRRRRVMTKVMEVEQCSSHKWDAVLCGGPLAVSEQSRQTLERHPIPLMRTGAREEPT
mmetsp:Transcript_27126/g.54585  ORF Transcript_27126/g.54585 Transcript_27126/m.54585 type:complete len:219 (-) Transcript_27126:369-1025(-)